METLGRMDRPGLICIADVHRMPPARWSVHDAIATGEVLQ